MSSKLSKPCGSGLKQPVAKKQASNIRILVDWGDAPAGIIHYLLCSKCGHLPSTTFQPPDIFLCVEGHVTCVLCGLSQLSCPYIRLRNGRGCRKMMSRMTMCIAQQRLTAYLASVLESDSDSDSDEDEKEMSPKVAKVPSTAVKEEKSAQNEEEEKEAQFSEDVLAETATLAEEIERDGKDNAPATIPSQFPEENEVTEKSEDVEVAEVPDEVEITEKSEENEVNHGVAEKFEKVEVAEKPDHVVITIEESPEPAKISLKQHMNNFTKQKVAEFSHLPLAEKIVAVKAAIEAELASHKKHK